MRNLKVVLLDEVVNPSDVVPLIERYAKRSGKDVWECIRDTFSHTNHSAWIADTDKERYIGYISGYVNVYCEFFIHAGYMDVTIEEAPELFDIMCMKISDCIVHHPKTFVIQTGITGRLWKKYGFKEHEVVYKKILGEG